MDQALEHKESDVKYFLLMLWKNRYVFGVCLALGLGASLLYAYVVVKPMFDGLGIIDTGYILNDSGAKARIMNTPEIAKELEEVFIESRKYLPTENFKDFPGVVKEIQIDAKNQGLPFVRVLVRGKTQEGVKEVLNQVLAYVQEKNKDRLKKQEINLNYLVQSIDAKLNNIENNTLPYLESKILRAEDDIKELKKELKKESLSPTQYQTLSNYLGQLQASIDSSETNKFSIQNQTLLELEQQKAKYQLMLGEDSLKNASYVVMNIAPEPTLGIKKWILFVMGIFSGIVLGVLVVSAKELYAEFKKIKP